MSLRPRTTAWTEATQAHIVTANAFFKVPLAWGARLVLSLLGIVLFQLVVIVEQRFFPWAVDTDKPTL